MTDLDHALRFIARRIEACSARGDRAGLLIATGQYHGLIARAISAALAA